MKYSFSVQEPYKSFLLNWQKTIEWRLNKWKYAEIQKWDILQFDTGESFVVENVTKHNSFIDMIKEFGRENIIPDSQTDEDANDVYYTIYTPEDEEKYWVCAIHVKKI